MIKTPHWPVPLGQKPIDLGLERVREALARLGHPEEKLPPVIHIAGTNGKGSTIAFMRAIFEAAGYKTHVYTSPHLVEFNERIVLAGEPIGDDMLYNLLEECRQGSRDINLTFFEGTTLAAILAFSRVEADIVLLETGMGGRLDATNIMAKPALTVITPVSMDHGEYLGDTVEKIAGEKAAIMKRGVTSVIAQQGAEVMAVMRSVATDIGADLFEYGNGWRVENRCYYDDMGEIELPVLPLRGEHQYDNAGVAIAAIRQLEDFDVSEQNILRGLQNAKWHGRLQRLRGGDLVDIIPDGSEIFVDGGHNVDAAGALAEYIKTHSEKPSFLIVGMLNNRDVAEYLRQFVGVIHTCYAVPIPGEDGCHAPDDICAAARELGMGSVAKSSVEEAVRDIMQKEESFTVYICGSLYLVGSVLESNE